MIPPEERLETIKRHLVGSGLDGSYDPVLMASFGRYAKIPHKHYYRETIRHPLEEDIEVAREFGRGICQQRELMCVYCNCRVVEQFIPERAEAA